MTLTIRPNLGTTRATIAAALAVIFMLTLPYSRAQEPVFRMRTDAVAVSVAVRARNRPVAGLTPADFQLLDNGVPQKVSSTGADASPVDVSLVVDTSGSLTGAAFQQLKTEIQQMARLLKPEDRVRLLSFANRVVDITGLQSGTSTLPLDRLTAGGRTTLHNALGAALMLSPGAERPHLVFCVTDGFDNASVLTPRDVAELAAASSATLYLGLLSSRFFTVVGGGGGSSMGPLQGNRFGAELPGMGSTRIPVEAPHQRTLRDAAIATGGAFFVAGATDTLPTLFRRVLDDFRANYVLRYSPSGVPPAGWHEITVTVPRRPDLSVHARKGYESN
jgi:VWFA-related protein